MTASHRILVVDDQPEILDLTAHVLGTAGYDVVTLGSGADALRRLEAEGFDLLLLDINMPGLDGWEVLRMVRADAGLAAMPVVMFSVKGELADRIQSLQEGATDYIPKPFVSDELLSRIARVLGAAG